MPNQHPEGKTAKRGQELINEIKTAMEIELIRAGVIKDAAAVSMVVSQRICECFGGVTFYLPKNMDGRRGSRDENIFREFTGNNTAELAKKYYLTEMRIRQIIAKERSAQPRLI